ncbi:MAG: carboxypeptidase regulatory-like domain-containing protein [Gemmatimonadota bacterium]|nr:carboxypeptidase regulatory-like domain-containing protein [Gemmatimonadota bacterium]
MRLLRISAGLMAAIVAATPAAAQYSTRPKAPPEKADTAKAKPATAAAKLLGAPPGAVSSKYGYLQGVAIDSIHGEPLSGALVQVEGTGRMGATDSLGRFLVDSILPGTYRLLVEHPMLDTLGIQLVTPKMTFEGNAVTRAVIGVPSANFLTGIFCPGAKRVLGPGALVGRVREPDTDVPAEGARVSFVWYDPDPPGLPASIKVKKIPRVRSTEVNADGVYKLCGLPDTFEGKLQAQRKDGGATAEVTVTQSDAFLTLRSMSVAAMPTTVAADSTGAKLQKGVARVFGRVLNASGGPVANARVGVMGASSATKTRENGDFVLDSLPSGTQALVVRQLGYTPTEQTVELSARTPARVTVKLGVFVPTLSAVEVVSARDLGLQKVGFTERKRSAGGGYFLDPDMLEKRQANRLTDFLTTTPGLRVLQAGNGQVQLVATRGASGGNGCVTVFMDGAEWKQLDAGDLDSFVRPGEVSAIEVYPSTNVPAQFTTVGSNCAAVVVWTKLKVETRKK